MTECCRKGENRLLHSLEKKAEPKRGNEVSLGRGKRVVGEGVCRKLKNTAGGGTNARCSSGQKVVDGSK